MQLDSPVFDLFVQGPRLLREAVAGMSIEQLRARPVAGRWSTLEVIAHLVDSEQCYCHRMKRVIAEDRPLLVAYDETRFTERLGYQTRDPERELDLFQATREQMILVLRGLNPEDWTRLGVHTFEGLLDLATMVRYEAEHVTNHIVHVVEKRRALGI
ncbi:MAG: DinB family protein [Isosphaeraceae bacterium]|nr:DinB family protein [Isosphaeraceae bacterium]